METFLAVTGVIILALIVYFNFVATVIVFKTPGSATLFNIFRTIFIWLIPIIGFSFLLRFTQQSFNCTLHYKLIPRIMQRWLYDDQFTANYSNANRDYDQARRFGSSEMQVERRKRF